MPGALHTLLARDHERLDMLLAECIGADGKVDEANYAEFRRGLLRHIPIEERILFHELRLRTGETELLRQLHRDHAVLTALLVPPPAPALIHRLASFLRVHNALEEASGGLHEIIESLQGLELDLLMDRVSELPAVPVAPHVDTFEVHQHIEELMREADRGRRRLSTDVGDDSSGQ